MSTRCRQHNDACLIQHLIEPNSLQVGSLGEEQGEGTETFKLRLFRQ